MDTVKFGSGQVSVTSGTEGPFHDPYGYTEIDVWKNGILYEFHGGLAVWVNVAGERVAEYDEKECFNLFTLLTGWSPAEWMHIVEKARNRRRRCKCGCRHTLEMDGYPGETFTICADCRAVLDCDFNISAII